MNILLAQIFGIIAIIVFAIIPHQKNKNKVLFFQIMSSLLYCIQYLLLGAFSAVASDILDILRSVVFFDYAKKDKKIPIYFLIGYIILVSIFGIFTFNNVISLIPIISSIIYTYAIWQDNLKIFRIINIFGIVIWIIYNFYVSAYVSLAGNVFQLISAIIAVIRFDIKKSENKEVANEE